MRFVEIIRNISFALSGNVLSFPLQLLCSIIVARSLGPEKYGVFSFSMEFGFVFSRFADAGLGVLANREIARHGDKAGLYLGSLFFLKIVLSIAFYAVMVIVAVVWGLSDLELMLVCLLGGGNFLFAVITFLFGVYRAFGKMVYEGLLSLFQPGFYLVLLLAAVKVCGVGEDIVKIALAFVVSYVVVTAIGYHFTAAHLQSPTWKWEPQLLRHFCKESVHLLAAVVLIGLYSRTCFFFLKTYSSPSDIGHFTIAFRLSYNLGLIPSIIGGAWLSTLSKTFLVETSSFHDNLLKMFGVLVASGIVLSTTLTILGRPIIKLLFGAQYLPAVPAFKIMMWSTFFFFVNFGLKTVFESSNMQFIWSYLLAIGFVSNVLCCHFLVPEMNTVGAGYALLIANGLITCFGMIMLSRRVVALTTLLKRPFAASRS